MLFIAVDDERPSLENFLRQAQKLPEKNEIIPFHDPYDALVYLQDNHADIAVLATEMMGMSGLEVAMRAKELCPEVKVIFTEGFSSCAQGPFGMSRHGYLNKPVDPKALEKEIAHAITPRKPLPETCLRTFGRFDLVFEGVSVTFSKTASKEMLAFLVYRRGQWVGYDRLAALLSQDGDTARTALERAHSTAKSLRRDLKAYGLAKLIKRRRNGLHIDISAIPCDLDRFSQGNVDAVNAYKGVFMSQYPWAHISPRDL